VSIDPTDRTPGAIERVADATVEYWLLVLPNAMRMVAYRGAVPILGVSSGLMYYARENILDQLPPGVRERTDHPDMPRSIRDCGLMPACVADLEAQQARSRAQHAEWPRRRSPECGLI
jgi:hypothetical protein